MFSASPTLRGYGPRVVAAVQGSQGLPLDCGLVCALRNVTSDIVHAAFEIAKCLELELVTEELLRVMSPCVVHNFVEGKAI